MATRRFRVEQTDDGSVLVDRENTERTVEVRQSLVHLTMRTRILRVCRSLLPGGLERWLTLDVVELSIGSEGDYSELSVWFEDDHDRFEAEDRIFGIDGDNLWDLEVSHARVVDLDARGRSGHPYIERTTESGEDDDENRGPVADLWYHTGEDDSGYRWSALVLTVGFPEPQFSELVDACESGRADTVVLECSCRAGTTGWAFQSPRDLVLLSGDSVRLHIDKATASAPVLTGTSASLAREGLDDHDDGPDDVEWGRGGEESLQKSGAPGGPGLLVLAATIAVALVSALFGAGAIAVLTIAILGGTAALIATLLSIGRVLIERLTSLAEVVLQRGSR